MFLWVSQINLLVEGCCLLLYLYHFKSLNPCQTSICVSFKANLDISGILLKVLFLCLSPLHYVAIHTIRAFENL